MLANGFLINLICDRNHGNIVLSKIVSFKLPVNVSLKMNDKTSRFHLFGGNYIYI